jgi:hypothetical protein
MNTRTHLMTDIVRPIALAWVCVTFGSFAALVLKATVGLHISKLTASAITFLVAASGAFALFPKILKQPFGAVELPTYLRRIGFYFPKTAWKHILLGVLLAIITLCGMLVGSLFTGRYTFDPDTINLTQILFSLNPGIWEEFFFRGLIMFICIRLTGSIRRAALLQILLFGLAHIKGVDLWSWVDVLSVMILAAAFTYTAWKTRTLVAGIVFHFLHDAFLFVPQLPGTETTSTVEKLAFFGCLWLAVGLVFLLVKLAAERLGVTAEEPLYVVEKVRTNRHQTTQAEHAHDR